MFATFVIRHTDNWTSGYFSSHWINLFIAYNMFCNIYSNHYYIDTKTLTLIIKSSKFCPKLKEFDTCAYYIYTYNNM